MIEAAKFPLESTFDANNKCPLGLRRAAIETVKNFARPGFHGLVCLLLWAATAWGQQAQGPARKVRVLAVDYLEHEEIRGPKTGRKDYEFTLLIRGTDFPSQGVKKTVRRGDEFGGMKVGEFIDREPVWLPTDGYKPGTVPTLELIDTKSGKKFLLEIVPRGNHLVLSIPADE